MNRRWWLTAFGLCLALAFAMLGRWQLDREQVKRVQLAAAAAALAEAPQPLSDVLLREAESREAPTAGVAGAPGDGTVRIDRVAGTATFVDAPRLWLDNQRRGDRVGVRLYCVADPGQGASVLVDMGWLPIGAARKLPDVECPVGPQSLAGLLVAPPAAGLRLGPGLAQQADPRVWLAMRIEPADIGAAWQLPEPLAPRVLRLDPAVALGYERDLELLANTLPPEKHRGYALQWFGLAVATLVTILVLQLRRRRRP